MQLRAPLSASLSGSQSAAKSSLEWISIRSKLASDAFLILTSRCINSRMHPADDAPYKRVSAQALLSPFLIGVQFKAKEEVDLTKKMPQQANVICIQG